MFRSPAPVLGFVLTLVISCAPPVAPPTTLGPGPTTGTSGGLDASITDNLYLSIDGVPGGFVPWPMTLPLPTTLGATSGQWDLGSLIGYPTAMSPGKTNVALVVTAAGHTLTDPALTAADISQIQITVYHAIDATHYASWSATVANPSTSAHFGWATTGAKLSLHLEAQGTPGSASAGVTTTTPALVFQVRDLPIVTPPATGGTLADALFLSVDGVSGAFSSQTASIPFADLAYLKSWKLVTPPGSPMVPNQIYTNLLLQTGGKSLTDPSVTAADITSAELDITRVVDATHAAGWTLKVTNPASVPGAHFTFSNAGGTISTHFEGTGTVKPTNSNLVAAAPALVFQATNLPAGLTKWP